MSSQEPFIFTFFTTIFPILFAVVFIIAIGGMLYRGARYLKNASASTETVHCKIIAKRMEVKGHTQLVNGTARRASSRTYYYITLELDNGERRELADVKGLYGLVVEGDIGYAAIKGAWITAFERTASMSPYDIIM